VSSHKTYQPFNGDAKSKKILEHKLLADDCTQITATYNFQLIWIIFSSSCSYEHLQQSQICTFTCHGRCTSRVASTSYGNSLGINAIWVTTFHNALLLKISKYLTQPFVWVFSLMSQNHFVCLLQLRTVNWTKVNGDEQWWLLWCLCFTKAEKLQAKVDKPWVPGHPGDYILYDGT
jgi:hypothetical protein